MNIHEFMLPIIDHAYYRINKIDPILDKRIKKYVKKKKKYPYEITTYYGSRNSGKSHNVYRALITHMMICSDDIIVMRWIQNSISQSSFSQIKSIIDSEGLSNKFKITNKYIQCILTGAKMEFRGVYMQGDSIRSLSDSFKIVVLEECQQFKEVEMQSLLATVLRFEDVLVIPIFNVGLVSNPAYQRFVEKGKDEKSLVCLMNYYDNPFHTKDSAMERQRLIDKDTMSIEEYEAVWEGVPIRALSSAIFNTNIMDKLFKEKCNVDIEEFEKVIVSYDPAVSDKKVSEEDKSNSHAIVTVGFKNGVCYLLDMWSDVCSPDIACNKVVEFYRGYRADYVLYEENQGGLFVKSLILNIDNTIQLKSFRSITNKVQRASQLVLPINNNSIKVMNYLDCRDLEDQMRRMTSNGFIQNYKNESPDLLDTFGFAIIDLLNLNIRNTVNNILPPSIEFEDYYLENKIVSLYTEGNLTYVLKCSLYSKNNEMFLCIDKIENGQPQLIEVENTFDIVLTDRMYNGLDYYGSLNAIDKLDKSENMLTTLKQIKILDSNFKNIWDNYAGDDDSDSIFLRMTLNIMSKI